MSRKLRVGILEGDDIGHEIVPVAVEVALRPAAHISSWDLPRHEVHELGQQARVGSREDLVPARGVGRIGS